LAAYAGFPVAPTSATWSFGWGSVWTRWLRASTARSTRIFLDDLALWSILSIKAMLIASYADVRRSISTKRQAWLGALD
jgi:hypothetical protein